MKLWLIFAFISFHLYDLLEQERLKVVSLEETVDFLVDYRPQEEIRYDEHIERSILKVASRNVSKEDIKVISKSLYKYANEFGVPEDLMVSLLAQESGFNKYAISKAGAIGVGQVMPTTAKEIAAELKVDEYDLFDPRTNIRFSCYYLSKMLELFSSPHNAVRAYNAGPGKVMRVLRGEAEYTEETVDYHNRIIAYRRTLSL